MKRFLAMALLLCMSAHAAEQRISELNPADAEALGKQRAVVEHYLGDDRSRQNYRTPAGKLGLIRALLEAKKFGLKQTYELQCLGVVLGDVFVQDMDFHWVIVEDSYGRDPALQYKATSIMLFPLIMISKRVERGESVDVFALYNGVAAEVEKQQRKAADAKP
jgi:Domain of unknown function (DUF3806)